MNHPVLVRAPSGEGFEDITPINLSPDGTGTVELVDGEEEFPFDTPALAVRDGRGRRQLGVGSRRSFAVGCAASAAGFSPQLTDRARQSPPCI